MTSLYALDKILKSDAFQLRPVDGTGADKIINKGYPFYFSTSRTRNNSFTSIVGNTAVLLTLDGVKLGNKYKGGAVDYWGEEYRKINPRGYEQEDRVFSPKGFIQNASSYITKIDILIKPEESNGNTNKMLRTVALKAKQLRIPVYVYQDKNDFKLSNKSKASSIIDLIKSLPKEDSTPYSPRIRTKKDSILFRWWELISTPSGKELSYDAKRIVERYFNNGDIYRNDAISTLGADLHNSVSGRDNERNLGVKIQEFLHKKKFDLPELIDYLEEKWKMPIKKTQVNSALTSVIAMRATKRLEKAGASFPNKSLGEAFIARLQEALPNSASDLQAEYDEDHGLLELKLVGEVQLAKSILEKALQVAVSRTAIDNYSIIESKPVGRDYVMVVDLAVFR